MYLKTGGTKMTDRSELGDVELLSQAISTSGMSVGDYARQVLTRDDVTVRRWLKGEQPLPKEVRRRLERGQPSVAEMEAVLEELVQAHQRMGQSQKDALDRGLLGAIMKAQRLFEG